MGSHSFASTVDMSNELWRAC